MSSQSDSSATSSTTRLQNEQRLPGRHVYTVLRAHGASIHLIPISITSPFGVGRAVTSLSLRHTQRNSSHIRTKRRTRHTSLIRQVDAGRWTNTATASAIVHSAAPHRGLHSLLASLDIQSPPQIPPPHPASAAASHGQLADAVQHLVIAAAHQPVLAHVQAVDGQRAGRQQRQHVQVPLGGVQRQPRALRGRQGRLCRGETRPSVRLRHTVREYSTNIRSIQI